MSANAPWRSVLLLMGAVAVVGANALLLSPVAPAIALDLETDPITVMGAASVYGLATMVSSLTATPFAARIGPARSLTLSLALLAAAFFGAASAESLMTLKILIGLAGVATGVALPASYTLGALISPPGKQAATMGLVLFGWTLTIVLGVSGSALIADLLGWRWVYGGFGGLAAILTFLALRTDLPNASRQPAGLLKVWRVPGFAASFAVMGAMMLGFYLTYSLLGAHVSRALGASTSAAGLVVLCYGIGFGASALIDPVIDKIGPVRAARPLMASLTLFYLTYGPAGASLATLAMFALLWGVAQHLALNLVVGRMASLSPDMRSTILGWNTAVTYLAVFLGAAIGGRIYVAFGWTALTLVSAALLLAVTVEAFLPRPNDQSSNISL